MAQGACLRHLDTSIDPPSRRTLRRAVGSRGRRQSHVMGDGGLVAPDDEDAFDGRRLGPDTLNGMGYFNHFVQTELDLPAAPAP